MRASRLRSARRPTNSVRPSRSATETRIMKEVVPWDRDSRLIRTIAKGSGTANTPRRPSLRLAYQPRGVKTIEARPQGIGIGQMKRKCAHVAVRRDERRLAGELRGGN